MTDHVMQRSHLDTHLALPDMSTHMKHKLLISLL